MTWKENLARVLGGMILGVLAALMFMKPQVKTVTEWREKTVTQTAWKTVTKMKVAGMPGATVIIQPDGTTIIYGPMTLDLTASATGESHVTHEGGGKTTVEPAAWSMFGSLGAVASPAWPPSLSWTAQVGKRVGRVLGFDIGAALQVQGKPGLWVPDQAGLALVLTW
jgi:hypothetical protein